MHAHDLGGWVCVQLDGLSDVGFVFLALGSRVRDLKSNFFFDGAALLLYVQALGDLLLIFLVQFLVAQLGHKTLIRGEFGLCLLLVFKVVDYHVKIAQDLIIVVICFIYLFGDFM